VDNNGGLTDFRGRESIETAVKELEQKEIYDKGPPGSWARNRIKAQPLGYVVQAKMKSSCKTPAYE
jgi:hypothetical protein